MNALMDKIADKILPFAEVLSKNKYLAAIRNAFVTIMPIIIGCSLCTLLNSVFLGKGNYFDKWFGFQGLDIVNVLGAIGSAGMNIMALLIVYLLAKNLAKEYKIDEDAVSVTAVVCFLIITTFGTDAKAGEYIRTYYLGAAGLFTAFIAAFATVEIMRRLMKCKALIIKMPDSVPSGIARSFNSMIPVIITMFIFGIVRFITNAVGTPLNDLIFNFIQTPLTAIITSPVGIVVIYFLYMLLWGFGIHTGYIISQPILEPIFLINLTQNAAAITAGHAATHILTKPFTDSLMFMGGAGNMLALVLAILIVSKRKDYKQIAKLGFIPSLFNISEPIMFGLPVVMNPVLIIPMILVTLVSLGIGTLATVTGFMGYTYVMTPWTTPPLMGGFFATGGKIGGLITAAICLVISVLIYMPFVKAMDKELEKEEEK